MPLKSFQENYWNLSDTAAPPPTPVGRGGYPGWQASVVASLFGALWEQAKLYLQRLRWWLATVRRLWALPPEVIDEALTQVEDPPAPVPPTIEYIRVDVPVPVPAPPRQKAARTRVGQLLSEARRFQRLEPASRRVIQRTMDALEGRHFSIAQSAVQQTATTDGFQRPEAWRSLTHLLKADQGRAENMYRHLKAREMTRSLVREQGSTLSNPQIGLLVELAYQHYSITGRR